MRGATLALMLGLPAAAQQQPLSASDWLSGSLKAPPRESSSWRPGQKPPPGVEGAAGNPRPVAPSGSVGQVQVTRLGHGDPDAAGTQSPRRAGLPADLWQGSATADLLDPIRQTPARLPAMTALMLRLLTAQLPPPIPGPADAPADTDSGADTGAGPAAVESGQLLLARADRLLDMGALDRAQALLMATGAGDPQIFRRLFDIALLEGDESRACDIMNTTPGIAPSFAARIFCLAQTGDWAAAAISLSGAERLRLISADQALLMQHFLDDTFVDSGEVLEPSQPMTPLNFRIFEAIGQPLPSLGLPIAFAQSDLRANNGWKTRLEAAERLARIGAIDPGRLRAIYAEQKPPASGGVWERAGAMRTLEAALAQGDPAAALPAAFDHFRAAGMADVLAAMVADELPPNLEGRAGEVASWLRQWQGLPAATPLPTDPVLLSGQTPPPAQRRGEALLAAMADIDAGLDGDLARAGRGLAVLRGLGLEADADLAAAQLSLLLVMTKAPQ